MAKLPDWNRVCRRIVDGDGTAHKRCVRILEEETSGTARALEGAEGPAKKPWYQRMLEGETGSWVTLAIPVAALGIYLLVTRPKTPEQPTLVATTS